MKVLRLMVSLDVLSIILPFRDVTMFPSFCDSMSIGVQHPGISPSIFSPLT
jgi:hypothetical protein